MVIAQVMRQDPVPEPFDEIAQVRLRWWFEVIALLVMYVVYSAIRNNFGSATVSPEHAFGPGADVI